MLQARLNATYFFAFGLNAEKVPENISQLKGLAASSDGLKKKADVYLETFNRGVHNNEALQKNIKQIEELAEKTLKTANEIGSQAISAFTGQCIQRKKVYHWLHPDWRAYRSCFRHFADKGNHWSHQANCRRADRILRPGFSRIQPGFGSQPGTGARSIGAGRLHRGDILVS